MFNLRDGDGKEINTEDIVKAENFVTGTTRYYLCGKSMLYLYDENGLYNKDSFMNIKIDYSVTLINDEKSRWTRMGTEAEAYDLIFG